MKSIRLATVVLLAVLAGCASDPNTTADLRAFTSLIPTFAGKGNARRPAISVDAILSSDKLSAVKQPLLLAKAEKTGAVATLTPVASNGTARTWKTADNITLTFRHGILVETRGLGGDLMSSDVSEVLPALRRSGRAVRTYRWLNGENRVTPSTFVCTYSAAKRWPLRMGHAIHETHRIDERCTSETYAIVNSYWIDVGDGLIWKSRQWVGPNSGGLDIYRLHR